MRRRGRSGSPPSSTRGRGTRFAYGFEDLTQAEWTLLEALAARTDVTVSLPYEPGRAAFASLSRTADDLAARGVVDRGAARRRGSYLPPPCAPRTPPVRGRAGAARRARRQHPLPRRRRCARDRGARRRRGARSCPCRRARRGVAIVCDSVERWRGPLTAAFSPSASRTPSRSPLASGRRISAAPCSRCCATPGWAAAARSCSRSSGRRSAACARCRRLRRGPAAGSRGQRARSRRGRGGASARRAAPSSCPPARGPDARRRGARPGRGAGGRRPRRPGCPGERHPGGRPSSCRRRPAGPRRARDGGACGRGSPLAAEEVVTALERTTVRPHGAGERGRVVVVDLRRARTRRCDVVFALGLEEGRFPDAAAARRSSTTTRGALGGRLERADPVERDRYLFYTACTRPRRRLVLVREAATDDGVPGGESILGGGDPALRRRRGGPLDAPPPTRRSHVAAGGRLDGARATPGARPPLGRRRPSATALAAANGWSRRLERAATAFDRSTRLRSPAVLDWLGGRPSSPPPSWSASPTAPPRGSSSA